MEIQYLFGLLMMIVTVEAVQVLPRVSYHVCDQCGGDLHQGKPLILDLQQTDDAVQVYFTIEWGDGSTTSTISRTVEHTYVNHGWKVIRITANDQSGTTSTTDGLVPAFVELDVRINPTCDCYLFAVFTAYEGTVTQVAQTAMDRAQAGLLNTLTLNRNSEHTLYIQVGDPALLTLQRCLELARTFHMHGASPTVSFSNASAIKVVEELVFVDEDDWSGWQIKVQTGNYQDTMVVEVADHQVQLGCSIIRSQVTLSIQRAILLSEIHTSSSSAAHASVLENENFTPNSILFTKSKCSTDYTIAYLSDSSLSSKSSSRTGGLIVETLDAFRSLTYIIDLVNYLEGMSLVNSTSSSPPEAVCPEYIGPAMTTIYNMTRNYNCTGLQVYDIMLNQANILFATNMGLLKTSFTVGPRAEELDMFSTETASPSPATISKVVTGISVIDQGSSDSQHFIFSDDFCAIETQSNDAGDPIALAINVETDSPLFVASTDWTYDSWYKLTPHNITYTSSISDLDYYRIVSLAYLDITESTVFLLGPVANAVTTSSNYLPYIVVQAQQATDSNSNVLTAQYSEVARFQFPTPTGSSSDLTLAGLRVSATGLTLYAFGNQVWSSVNGGNDFQLRSRLPVTSQMTESELVHGFQTAARHDSYLVTDKSQAKAYYGRNSVDYSMQITPLQSAASTSPNHFAFYLLDRLGEVRKLTLLSPANYSRAGDTTASASLFSRASIPLVANHEQNVWNEGMQGIALSPARTGDRTWHLTGTSVPERAADDTTFDPDGLFDHYVHESQQFKLRDFEADGTAPFSNLGIIQNVLSKSSLFSSFSFAASVTPLLELSGSSQLFDDSLCSVSACPALAYDLQIILQVNSSSALSTIYKNAQLDIDNAWDPYVTAWASDFAYGSKVTLHLSSYDSSGAQGEGWLFSDCGSTISVEYGLVLITHFVNSSIVYGQVQQSLSTSSGSNSLRVATGSWSIYQLGSRNELATVGQQTLSLVSTADGKSASITLSSNSNASQGLQFSPTVHHNAVFVLVDNLIEPSGDGGYIVASPNSSSPFYAYRSQGIGWGVITNIISGSTATVTASQSGSFTGLDGSYAPGSFSIHQLASWLDFASLPSLGASKPRWSLSNPDCPYAYFSDGDFSNERITYLDQGDSSTLLSAISPHWKKFVVAVHNPNQVVGSWKSAYDNSTFVTEMSNSGYLSPASSEFQHVSVNSVKSVELTYINAFTSGESSSFTAVVTPAETAYTCSHSIQYQHVSLGCPPTKKIFYQDLTLDQWRYPEKYGLCLDGHCTAIFEYLPINYRPPSDKGKAVPTNDYIYNADPFAERYRNYFPVSQNSGSFQQCAQYPNDEDCACIDTQRASEFIADSDCINKVKRVFFVDTFVPALWMAQDGLDTKRLELPLNITELNGRTDYCFNKTSCTGGDSDRNQVFLPAEYDGITWLGDELYHFRVQVVDDTNCALSTEFKIYVIKPSLDSTTEGCVIAITAQVIGLIIFFGYLAYVNKYGLGFQGF